MVTCNSVCNREATEERELGAAFSMTSTASASSMTVKLCKPCADQNDRAAAFNGKPTLSKL